MTWEAPGQVPTLPSPKSGPDAGYGANQLESVWLKIN